MNGMGFSRFETHEIFFFSIHSLCFFLDRHIVLWKRHGGWIWFPQKIIISVDDPHIEHYNTGV